MVGGIAGSWFTHLSAALVSGLFFSTALTLIMVPVMITAPTVIWGQIKSVGRFFGWLFGVIGRPFARAFGLGRRRAATPEGAVIEIPADVDSARRYLNADGTGLVETERNGVTVVSRQAAE